jgi:membrane glycosyltransferase
VLQVLRGADGGWPAQTRGDGTLSFRDAWAASHWIVTTGGIVLAMAQWLSPALVPWLLPVALPMALAPAIIAWSSRPSRTTLFRVESEIRTPAIMQLHDGILARWAQGGADLSAA